ncbi:MAG: Crp/Fnr family transcriptional regulator [Thermomicrobiales bacterium]
MQHFRAVHARGTEVRLRLQARRTGGRGRLDDPRPKAAHSAQLFTLLSGWAFRYKTLEDGRRQILNYLLPGDLVGLQGSVIGEMEHSVESLSPVVLCVFQRDSLPKLFRNQPGLAFDVTWLASREERMLDENLLSVGPPQRAWSVRPISSPSSTSAPAQVGLTDEKRLLIPITQQHVADTLGLSIVHTNKTLRKLADRKLIRWHDRACEVLDEPGSARGGRMGQAWASRGGR